MPGLPALLDGLGPDGAGFAIEATADWVQGRTLYGGLSAALCLRAALLAVSDLPPLRTAHFTFAGPASGPLRLRPDVLRRGRSVVVLNVDLDGEAGLAVRAVLTFGAARQSALSYRHVPAPAVPRPQDCGAFFGQAPGPAFFQHFDVRQAGSTPPLSGAARPAFLLWVRHLDATGVEPLTALLALADAPPPAAFAMLDRPAPISTVTWAVNVLSVPSGDDDGWRLISTSGDTVEEGYSSQSMTVWDSAGLALISAQQNVAVFG